MDQEFTINDYNFRMVTEDDFGDLKTVTEGFDASGQKRLFEWSLSRQSWYGIYVVRHHKKIVGRFEIKTVNGAIPVYEAGNQVLESERNLGHGCGMIIAGTEYIQKQLGARRVQCVVAVENKSSNAMMRKTDYELEATLKNYSLTVAHDPCDANIYSMIF